MINKLVILRYAPYTQNVSLFFSVNYLVEYGVSIDYLDVSLITTGESGSYFANDQIDIRIIRNYNELEEYVRNQDKSSTLFIPFMSFFHKTFNCFYLLSKYNCLLGYCITGFFPTIENSSRKKIFELFKEHNLKRVYNVVLNQLCNFIKNRTTVIKAADIIYYSGSKAPLREYKTNECTRFAELNSIDYEMFNSSLQSDAIVEKEEYIVFIDQYLPFHPDANINGLSAIEPNAYYKNLNRFFTVVESYYGVKVVIAAHPKAIKYRVCNYFDNRAIYWGNTLGLVKYASVVIMHFSTSVSFSVLYHKPILFVSMPEIKSVNLNYHNTIISFSKALDSTCYYLDEQWGMRECNFVNRGRYEEYKYAYLTNNRTERQINGLSLINSFYML